MAVKRPPLKLKKNNVVNILSVFPFQLPPFDFFSVSCLPCTIFLNLYLLEFSVHLCFLPAQCTVSLWINIPCLKNNNNYFQTFWRHDFKKFQRKNNFINFMKGVLRKTENKQMPHSLRPDTIWQGIHQQYQWGTNPLLSALIFLICRKFVSNSVRKHINKLAPLQVRSALMRTAVSIFRCSNFHGNECQFCSYSTIIYTLHTLAKTS